MEHRGLLVVSFGTSYPETRKRNIEHIESLLSAAFRTGPSTTPTQAA